MNNINECPTWMQHLENDDLSFIKRFILASGSLKEVAREYGVSYPTVRLRLDRLIQKIQAEEELDKDRYINTIKSLAINEKIDLNTAKILIEKYRQQVKALKGGG